MVSCLDWDCDIILCALEGSVVSWLSSTGETDYLGAFYSTVRRKDAMVDSIRLVMVTYILTGGVEPMIPWITRL